MSGLDLKPTRVEQTIKIGDESGYAFTITAIHDDEWAWQASVTLSSFGFTSAEGAVKHLRAGAEHLARMLARAPGGDQAGGER